MDGPTPGQLLKRRARATASARRAWRPGPGTTQSAISRIESDRVSPSVETLRASLHLLGEDLVLTAAGARHRRDRAHGPSRIRRVDPADRVRDGLAFADLVRRNRG